MKKNIKVEIKYSNFVGLFVLYLSLIFQPVMKLCQWSSFEIIGPLSFVCKKKKKKLCNSQHHSSLMLLFFVPFLIHTEALFEYLNNVVTGRQYEYVFHKQHAVKLARASY